MNKQTQKELFETFVGMQRDLLDKKWDDYATDDRLSNFKLSGPMVTIKPEQVCLSLIAIKVARLGQLLSGKIPKNENIDDSILDLANYAFLLHCLRKDGLQSAQQSV